MLIDHSVDSRPLPLPPTSSTIVAVDGGPCAHTRTHILHHVQALWRNKKWPVKLCLSAAVMLFTQQIFKCLNVCGLTVSTKGFLCLLSPLQMFQMLQVWCVPLHLWLTINHALAAFTQAQKKKKKKNLSHQQCNVLNSKYAPASTPWAALSDSVSCSNPFTGRLCRMHFVFSTTV